MRRGVKKRLHKPVRPGEAAYNLPGVGEGLVDPDFDVLSDAERDQIVEGVMGHGRSEDFD